MITYVFFDWRTYFQEIHSVCMYIYVYVYLYIYIHTFINAVLPISIHPCISIHACLHPSTYIQIQSCMPKCLLTYIHTNGSLSPYYVHAYVHIGCIHTYIYIFIHVYQPTYLHAYIHIYIHMYIPTYSCMSACINMDVHKYIHQVCFSTYIPIQ